MILCSARFWRQEYMTLLEQYEREREEGRAEGLAEGHAKGLEEGHAKGLEEGHAKGLEEGRTEERKNTERERRRADVAEAKIKELEKLLAEHR
jgi:flagellar biosynthesis/type III secretory pathway protein FliH